MDEVGEVSEKQCFCKLASRFSLAKRASHLTIIQADVIFSKLKMKHSRNLGATMRNLVRMPPNY